MDLGLFPRPKLGVSFCSGVFCNRTFDMYICWPDGFPGTTVNVSCPWYLPWQSRVRDRYAFRYCSDNGSWLLDLVSQGPWADSSQCAEDDVVRHSIQRKLRFVYTAGYTLSLISLVAFLLSHRKLRCTRNYIHVNLFSSFILRAISVLLKDSFTDSPDSESVPCRAAQLLLHYSVASSWYWLLVEGIFLYTLLVLSVFSPTKSYRLYLMIGWGMAEGIMCLCLCRCWRQNSNMGFWWILRAPLLLTKSTLILIPMLGVHEIVLALVTDEMAEGTLRYLKLSVELFFGSVQGFLVAVLYCFINREVSGQQVNSFSPSEIT
uniref:Glucagon-like peptide 1 receptor n=1 Tax=Callorhinchus milii TaxID=7868 RepID=A0A4W3HSG0_CALMI